MNKTLLISTIILICACALLTGAYLLQGERLRQQVLDTEYQLELTQNWQEAYDSMYLDYQTACETADFWANAYEEAEGRYSELLNNPIVKEVEKFVPLRRFESVDEARGWITSHQLPVTYIASSGGEVNFNEPSYTPDYDCDDYADDYEQMALEDGILLWQCPVKAGRVWGVKVSPLGGNHIGLFTKIDNAFYYIEPQPLVDDKWKFVKILEAD